MQTTNIDELTKRLMPLTTLRRRAGEVLAKLDEVGEMVITKDGKPIAKLSSLSTSRVRKTDVEADLEKFYSISGGFKLGGQLTPDKMNKIIDQSYHE